MKVLPPFVACGAVRTDDEGRTAYLEAYCRRLERLESTQPLAFDPATCTSRQTEGAG